ncbi:MAG: sigma 54-interacting transcriptional regulator [Thermodesulfobacteriota bacterium]|nr:sigma 54-interacting transcriptional regulator [Thermodesulfobacteriota bacterium]
MMEAGNVLIESNEGRFDSSPTEGYSSKGDQRVFTLFHKVQKAMQHTPDFVEVCKEILDAVIDEMEAENCSLMLKDSVSGELSIVVARSRNEERIVHYSESSPGKNGKRFKPGEGVAGWVFKEGHGVMLNDVWEEPRFIKVPGLNHNKIRSLICFPIREKDQVVGVFNLSHSKKGVFSEGDKLLLSYISNQVGAAITSGRFFLEIKEMDRLRKDHGESSNMERTSSTSALPSTTFIEVGEMTQDNGMFIYTSEKMHHIKEIIDQVASTDVTVLIQGESGVGKEVVARSIHLNSSRRDKPFVKVNCAALPSELLESELFGYEKGAFTGAYRQKPGKFELANGGTIFLDEILEMSPSLQSKLLQVLQDREFSRLGGKKDIRVDVRVLVATNRNIEECVKNGKFREDLYYRLNVVNITVPPLRERKEEIPIFVEYFLEKYGKKFFKKVKPLSDQTIRAFRQHHWSGNVRELENVIQRFIVLGNEEMIVDELVPPVMRDPISEKKKGISHKKAWPSLKEVHRGAIIKVEVEIIRKALEITNWNRKKAADILNISYKALLYKIKDCGIIRQSPHLSS